MARKVSEFVSELADREAIKDCLLRYPRIMDRLDLSLAETFYWPEATDSHAGMFSGKLSQYFLFIEPMLRQMEQTQHCLSNMLIEIDGSEARVETYVVGYHCIGKEENKLFITAAGRYLDVLHKRDDEWRLFKRQLVLDWIKNDPDHSTWGEKLPEQIDGCRKPYDPSCGLFKRLG
jgi:hypothetical protein